MKKIKKSIMLLVLVYSAGVLIGLIFRILKLVCILTINGWKNFPHWKPKILVVSNHPYKGEQFLLIGLFFPQYLLRPFDYSPWNLADESNYYKKLRYFFMRPRLIPVDRRRGRGDFGSLLVARKTIASGGSIIVFPEGGRTGKGKSFLFSPSGKRMRPLKAGFALLAAEPGVTVVPVWCEFKGWSIRFTIGKPAEFCGEDREEIVKKTQQTLLQLADQN